VVAICEPSPVMVIDAVTISAAAPPHLSKIAPHLVGMNALAHLLGLSHDTVKSTFHNPHRLLHQIVRVGILVVLQQVGGNLPKAV